MSAILGFVFVWTVGSGLCAAVPHYYRKLVKR